MKSILENLNELECLIREIEKVESKLINGQEILAYRDLGRVLSRLRKRKDGILKDEK